MAGRMVIPLGEASTQNIPITGWESVAENNPPLPATPGSFSAPDLVVWHPGITGYDPKLPNGNPYNNIVAAGVAAFTNGGGASPQNPPHELVLDTVPGDDLGYYMKNYGDQIRGNYAEFPQVDFDEIYVYWGFKFIGPAASTVNTKGLRINGKGAFGAAPSDSNQNYEGLYINGSAGAPGIVYNPRNAVSPAQAVMLGLWQSTVGTNGNYPTSGYTNYLSNIIDDGLYHFLLYNIQLQGPNGNLPRVRFWIDGTPIVQRAGAVYNTSGFAFGKGSGGGDWFDPPGSDPDYSSPPSWLEFASTYPTPVGFGSMRFFDTQHAGNGTPGGIRTFGIEMSRQAIDPNRAMFS